MELGEVIARLVVHATIPGESVASSIIPLARDEALKVLEGIMRTSYS